MGMEFLDITFRAEKQFGVKLRMRDFVRLNCIPATRDPTAGELHDWICQACRAAGKPVPHSSWHRVKRIIVDATGLSPSVIRKDSLLSADLGIG